MSAWLFFFSVNASLPQLPVLGLIFKLSRSDRFVLTRDSYDEEDGRPGGLRTFIDPNPAVPLAANVLIR